MANKHQILFLAPCDWGSVSAIYLLHALARAIDLVQVLIVGGSPQPPVPHVVQHHMDPRIVKSDPRNSKVP